MLEIKNVNTNTNKGDKMPKVTNENTQQQQTVAAKVEAANQPEVSEVPAFAELQINKAETITKREKKVVVEEEEQAEVELKNSDVLQLYKKALQSKPEKAKKLLNNILESNAPIAQLVLSKKDIGSAMCCLFGERSIFANHVMKEHLAVAADAGCFVDLNSGVHYYNPNGDLHIAACFIRNTAAVLADMGMIKTKSLPYVETPSCNLEELNEVKLKEFKTHAISCKDIAEMHNGYSFEDEYKNGHPRKSFTIQNGEILQTKEKRVFIGNDEESYSPLKKDKKKKKKAEKAAKAAKVAKVATPSSPAAPADNSWTWGDTLVAVGVGAAVAGAAYVGYNAIFGDDDVVTDHSKSAFTMF